MMSSTESRRWYAPMSEWISIGRGSYADNGPWIIFSVRWTGYFVPRTDDDYKFYVSADDGVRLFINDECVIDDWQPARRALDIYSTHMEPGKPYKIRLEYFENVGTATVRFGIAAATPTLGQRSKHWPPRPMPWSFV